jgi:hypothetical protein
MAEYKEPRQYPMIIPLVEQVERVLENLEVNPSWFIDEESFEPYPETSQERSTGDGGGGGRKPPKMSYGVPADRVPFDRGSGPVAGYRSFRYFSPTHPAATATPGQALSNSSNIWGVMLPRRVCENLAHTLSFIRTGEFSIVLTEVDMKEARDVLYQYFLVHFLVDRACSIIENILEETSGTSYNLFLSKALVPGQTPSPQTLEKLGILSRHRMHHHAKTRGEAHHGIHMKTPTKSVNIWKGSTGNRSTEPKLPDGTIGASYSQLLSNLISLAVNPQHSLANQNAERILGLNFLIGAEIPSMENPDLYYKFSTDAPAVLLPVHVW